MAFCWDELWWCFGGNLVRNCCGWVLQWKFHQFFRFSIHSSHQKCYELLLCWEQWVRVVTNVCGTQSFNLYLLWLLLFNIMIYKLHFDNPFDSIIIFVNDFWAHVQCLFTFMFFSTLIDFHHSTFLLRMEVYCLKSFLRNGTF